MTDQALLGPVKTWIIRVSKAASPATVITRQAGERSGRVTPAPSIGTMLSRIGETQAPLPGAAALLIGLAALATVGIQGIWLLLQHANTIAHEGAHAIAASAVGRKVRGVTLSKNGDGLTTVDSGGAAGNILFYVVGYLGPSVFGLGAAKLIKDGHSIAVLWLALFLLILLLVVLHKAFSYLPVLVVAGLIYLIVRYGSVGANTAAAYGVTWFLLLSGVRKVIDHGSRAADAGKLLEITRLWRWTWVWLWLAGSITALVVGGILLV
jgi:Peptidase M50B-like